MRSTVRGVHRGLVGGSVPTRMFKWIPRETAFFDLFQKAAHNMIDGSRLLKDMVEDFRNPAEQVRAITAVEQIGDSFTHEIARKLNQTFITPIDREDIHGLASALDDILDLVEAVADRFVVFKIVMSSEPSIKLANILYQSSVAVGAGIDVLGKLHADITGCCVRINSLAN